MPIEHKIPVQFALLLAFALLAGCATTPKMPDDAVYATYGLYVTVDNLTADLLENDIIGIDQARAVQAKLQDIRPRIKAARMIVTAGGTVDNRQLGIIHVVQKQLLALQHQLQQEATQ